MVFCEGKSPEQVVAICERLEAVDRHFLGTRASEPVAAASAGSISPDASGIPWRAPCTCPPRAAGAPPITGTILVVSAGTSDLPVAEEAAAVAEAFGHAVSSG